MNVKRYFAPTAREALRALKEALGPDAIVLSNRAVEGGVEATIAAGRRSKTSQMAFSMISGATFSVPNVSRNNPTGRALPIA